MREVLQEKVTITRSSLIDFVVYNYQTRVMQVKFKRGKHRDMVKEYTDVTFEDFNEIITAESPGRALLKVLKRNKNSHSFLQKLKNFFTKY